ncbi:MAG: hypothetical protein P9X24_06360 [Candidatus Hatepunaea meridiana]|nr:hypothetical protein [Candidatus Hatepunaea meridiana]
MKLMQFDIGFWTPGRADILVCHFMIFTISRLINIVSDRLPFCHSREGGNPDNLLLRLDSRLRGNDK